MDPNSLLFVQARPGGTFALVLLLGLLLACGYALLLRRWPPTRRRILGFLGVFTVGATVLGWVLMRQELRFDFERRELRESLRVLGLGPERVHAFADFQSVRVDHAADGPGGISRYRLSLQGAGRHFLLQVFDDAAQAERSALVLARAGGWGALRQGYRLRVGGPLSEGLAAGAFQRVQTPSGRQALAIDLERWTRVERRPGEVSPIEPP